MTWTSSIRSPILISVISKREVHTALGMADVERLNGGLSHCGLAIIDVNLGAGRPNGLDVLRWLRVHRFGGRIVFMTGHASQFPLVAEARATGVEVLSKPMTLEQLRAVLDGAR